MNPITPCLWFDSQAHEAAEFYVSIFPNSKITHVEKYATETPSNKPVGSVMTVSFELNGHSFMGLNGGPLFTPNPSISFFVNFDPSMDTTAKEKLNQLWNHLSDKGKVLMPLQKYPFSEWYGWVQDKYGISWQLILTNPAGEERPYLAPSLLFVGNVCGKAEEAINLYTSVFPHSKKGTMARYPAGMSPDKEGTLMFADFSLNGQWLAAMDSAHDHAFGFNEGISFMISCENQEDMDHYYESLSAHPESEICGWMKDRFGVSWQVNPTPFEKIMYGMDPAKKKKTMEALLKMKRINLKELEEVGK